MATPTVGRPPANSRELRTASGNFTRSRSYDPRGSSKDRAARKTFMLTHPGFHRRPGTEGQNVNCTHCGKELDRSTVEADRKNPSGGYRRENIQPSCRSCNIRRSNTGE
jgi:hypothetical protein